MRIANNISALTAWRHYSSANLQLEKSMEMLSSGQRINRASDDVAGLAVSERMRTQIRSLRRAMRNIEDGISVVRVAESALNEITVMLQRGRELAVQATNGTLTPDDKAHIQTELDHLMEEIDRVSMTTEFNSLKLFNNVDPDVIEVVNSLRRSWLDGGEELVETYYGLTGDNNPLKIVIEYSGTNPAWVTVPGDGSGRLELHLNLSQLKNYSLPNGGTAPFHLDRIIAHEMTHAVMARNMDLAALPNWFVEGTAEYIAGGLERVNAELLANGGDAQVLMDELTSWEGTSADYAAAFVAVRYLDDTFTGPGQGVREVLARLSAGDTLDQALSAGTGGAFTTAADYMTFWQTAPNAQTYITALNPASGDTGAIGGGTAETVVPDTNTDTWDPLRFFREVWPEDLLKDMGPIPLHIGPNAGSAEQLGLNIRSVTTLRTAGVDVVNNPDKAIGIFDKALREVLGVRSELGAMENRLEHSLNANAMQQEHLTAAESRIRDTDMAWEMTRFTKLQVMLQAGVAMTAQAAQMHRGVVGQLLGALA